MSGRLRRRRSEPMVLSGRAAEGPPWTQSSQAPGMPIGTSDDTREHWQFWPSLAHHHP
jgi:hypothetical protein